MRRFVVAWAWITLIPLAISAVIALDSEDVQDMFQRAKRLMNDKNFREAASLYREVIQEEDASSDVVVESLRQLRDCRQQLRLDAELDADLNAAIASHPRDFHVYDTAATQILEAIHMGVVADQKFTRGYSRGYAGMGGVAGTSVNVHEQDRLQALRWRIKAIELAQAAESDSGAEELARLQLGLAHALLANRTDRQAWDLQELTDLTREPDYLDLSGSDYLPSRYAPVDESGNPVLHPLPADWDDAQSDGERLRWTVEQAQSADAIKWDAKMLWADFLYSQFSVETLQQDMWLLRSTSDENATKNGAGGDDSTTGVFALHTLAETETIARLASGVKRFSLADEFNPIRIYQQIAGSTAKDVNARAAWKLVQIFLNRRQYPKAAELLEAYIARFGDDRGKTKQQLLDSIRQPRLQFDPTPTQLADKKAKLSLLFRNATELRFTARRVDIERILFDTKEFYRGLDQQSRRGFGDKQNEPPPQLSSPASLFDEQRIDKYLLGQVAQWEQSVEPRPNHWDRRVEIESPLTEAGLYLVDVSADDNQHQARCLVSVQDTVLVRKPLDDKWLLHVADAASGQPIAGANIELFGYGRQQIANRARPSMSTENFAIRTNAQGLVEADVKENFQWFCVARTENGRLALLDFESMWRRGASEQSYKAMKAYGVSDRPVYRPGETVKAKFWLAFAVYGDVAAPRAINTDVSVTLTDPQGLQVAEKRLTTDEYGGCDLEIALKDSAPLGQYSFQVALAGKPGDAQQKQRGLDRKNDNPFAEDPLGNPQGIITSLAIRVEEYRKPEFEVEVLAPEKPVALGETIKARIRAKYYFGAPVTDAEVSVKVERSTQRDEYYPYAAFDWMYGRGYWWFAKDYDWYPGWAKWHGCIAPTPDWRPRWGYEPPELVLEQDVELDATGQAVIEIDTALAKALYGDEDHKYTISVDVRDSSRRTLSAQGVVLAAREAFKIYAWTDRGYYNVGDRIEAHFEARMLDGTPVSGQGTMDLLRITYAADMRPMEQVVASFSAETNADGRFTQELEAEQAGQYRLRLRLSDAQGHEVEGAYILTVRGQGASAADFRYEGLELVPDKKQYAPGETVKLQLAANHADALVAVFVRPSNGVYQPPRWVRLEDKSAILDIPVTEADQPNFFVEAYTIYDGEFHQELREIFVPPQERVLDVEVTADKSEYLPGEEAKLELTVKDAEGNPVVGSCAIAVYDRSLEQIAGDLIPQDIREFFWKWRRSHYPQQTVNVNGVQSPIQIQGQVPLIFLGMFGASLADDLDAVESSDGLQANRRGVEREAGAPFGGGMMRKNLGFGGAAEGMQAMSMAADAFAPNASLAVAAPPGGGTPDAQVAVRKDFADAALWLANLQTDPQGRANAKFKMPENLTSWQIRAWSVGKQTRVGSARTDAVTNKPLLVRLQTPRFLVERDEVVISAIVHNDLPAPRTVKTSLEIDGQTQFELLSSPDRQQTVTIAAHQQARVDWRCRALAEGMITLRAIAVTDDASDAMQLELPIVVNGLLKTESLAGTVRADQASSQVTMHIPEQRRVEQSKLTVQLSPSLAASMIDALPYLAEYPYGCTEQTLNRFLPTVVTQRVLQRMNVDLAQLKQKRNNLNTQELGDPQQRRQQWKRFDRNAVFDQELVDDMVEAGLSRLGEMQNGDGGWGWFSGVQETSTAHMTATVVRGLIVAQQNDVAIVPDVLQRGIDWLERYQTAELAKLQNTDAESKPSKTHPDNLDALVFHVLVMAGHRQPTMQERLYEQRGQLSTYGKALLAWATHQLDNAEQTAMLRRNIEQFLVEDPENETAFLRDQTAWWYWYGSEIEANALYLKLLSAVEPRGRVAPRIVKFLLNNRKHATYWNSTRDTALVVEAFADYLQATDEIGHNVTAEVWLSGKRLGSIEFTPQNLFEVDNAIELTGAAVPAGQQQLEIRRTGEGNLYWNAYATNFTLEPEIAAAGLEVKIERRYYHLVPTTRDMSLPGGRANVVEARKAAFDRTLVQDLQALPSGALVEVELLVQSKNDYEYLVIEDHKPASLETVETQSGYFYQAGLSIYRELRDKHVGLCIRWLPKGNYSIRYQMRSEAPGTFTALPAVIEGMYAPELRGNSSDFDLSVVD